MTAARLLAKLEDFRLLPIFVVVSMVIGIAIGNALSISDFTLTPPIDALKAIEAQLQKTHARQKAGPSEASDREIEEAA